MSVFTTNVVSENGEQFIPATQRPDGTWRKARRVKDGYVPQEEVPLYESKGKQIMNKKNEPIILPSGHVGHKSIPGLFILPEDGGEKKATKKKNKKKVEEVSDHLDNLSLMETPKPTENKTKKPSDKSAPDQATAKKFVETTDPEKKLKNLKKRLREVEALEEKIKNGTLAKPEPEQLTKIKRKNDLLLQIYELEKQVQQAQ